MIWTNWGPVKLTHKMHHHRCIGQCPKRQLWNSLLPQMMTHQVLIKTFKAQMPVKEGGLKDSVLAEIFPGSLALCRPAYDSTFTWGLDSPGSPTRLRGRPAFSLCVFWPSCSGNNPPTTWSPHSRWMFSASGPQTLQNPLKDMLKIQAPEPQTTWTKSEVLEVGQETDILANSLGIS